MTVLSELVRLYERMERQGKAPPPGYSMENIGGKVVLDRDGRVLRINRLGGADGKGKWQTKRKLRVPAPPRDRRGKKIVAGKLWDPTPYSLGVTALKDEREKPVLDETGKLQPVCNDTTQRKHAAFVEANRALVAGSDDPGLAAFRAFLDRWNPVAFADRAETLDLLDENLVFWLEGDTHEDGTPRYLHERDAARRLLANAEGGEEEGVCLITGRHAPIIRLHPAIKLPDKNAQSSGVYLVSFNIGSKSVLGASSSFGHEQGDNAPVSAGAAFAYGAALNALLARDSGHSLRVGDTTVAFWAEAAEAERAETLDGFLMGALDPPDDAAEARRLRALIDDIAKGRAPAGAPELDPQTRVFILGLAPNAARLSVRFWHPGRLGDFAANVARFWADLAQEPPAWKGPPAAWSLLCETAVQRKAENIPPRLGGDLMRAVLTGADYPRTLLSGVIMRIRADGDINARRVAIIAAHIRRNLKEEKFPMSLDRDNPDPAYRLGRLFAVLEGIQQAALPGLNATIKDRYFAAASATPARVFPLLVKTATHHLSNLRKGDGGGLAHWFEAEMGEIWSGLAADLPRSLNLEDQGRFIAGYYHQRWAKKDDSPPADGATGTPDTPLIETEGADQ